MTTELIKPDYLFEVSWEVCNKVGGIHTVIATKSKIIEWQYEDRYFLIGPDIWKGAAIPEFAEDTSLFKSWKAQASAEGLNIKIGRWKIPGNPIAILVDFTSLYARKNEIFSHLWLKYKLDSLTGGWDYIEPALFGYAAANVIESFYNHHLNNDDKIIAQFHEWMTGAGILYLKEHTPQIATVFTTHATVLGRAIAGSGVPFYSQFDSFLPEKSAADFMVVSKHSLEKVTAGITDCFTTVSEITARECEKFLGRKPDILTYNGFDISILPNEQDFEKNRQAAREKMICVAEGLFNQQIPGDSIFVIKSGRYEYRNKGIDVFIDSLATLQNRDGLDKMVIGVIFVPAHQNGPRKELLARMEHPDFSDPKSNEVLTHYLQGMDTDPILNEIEKVQLHNLVHDKVRIIFVPTYLNGKDGVFNMNYYELLIGFDLAVFPSYYEPWGYTPLESIAYRIPSVTTDVSGFGAMINAEYGGSSPGITVLERTDGNEKELDNKIAAMILSFSRKTDKEIEAAKEDAGNMSLNFLWDKLLLQYYKAYSIALEKSFERKELFQHKPQAEPILLKEMVGESVPLWRSVVVEMQLPGELQPLQKLSKNLWWSWHYEAAALFRYINPELWESCSHNPSVMIRSLSYKKTEELVADKAFLDSLAAVSRKFDDYMNAPVNDQPHTAYFSMEYGLCGFIKLYSGGLGILAGDYLKEASDCGVKITGVGLLYKNGYFRQKFSVHGEQLMAPDIQDFKNLPIQLVTTGDQEPLLISLFLPGRSVFVQVWKLDVGRVSLYLLDTDLSQNTKEDRDITAYLYGGDQEMRLKQEILLGLIGVRALNAIGIRPDVFHCNEGHAAFINIERISNYVKKDNLSFEEALEMVRSSTLFTTHTSVPAANDFFGEDMLRKYLGDKAMVFNIDWQKLIGMGRLNPADTNEKFSMTFFGARIAQEINAVSEIHKDVSRRLFNPLWKNYKPAELHIQSITNGVHYATWAAPQWQEFFEKKITIKAGNITDRDTWQNIRNVPAGEIWNIHLQLKRNLINTIKENTRRYLPVNSNRNAFNAVNNLDEQSLIIGFARRFVTYKRSALLFTDIERLSKILSTQDRPVVIIFSGKAHPRDQQSIDLITQLISYSANPAYKNAIIFLKDYDMDVAKMLVQGVDVWLNTPYRSTEASGTSGMKAAMNGVLNFSVLDGWWAEAYNGSNGWMLSELPVYNDPELQNQLDAETIYSTLENEIIPLFYDHDEANIPVKWVDKVKASLMSICPAFNMRRALLQYKGMYYEKLHERNIKLADDNFLLAKNIVKWKKKMLLHWSEVDVISIDLPEKKKLSGLVGEKITIRIILNIGKLSVNDVGVEIIICGTNPADDTCFVKDFSIVDQKEKDVTYECIIRPEKAGTFDYAFRIYPKNEQLPHKQDFDVVKWI